MKKICLMTGSVLVLGLLVGCALQGATRSASVKGTELCLENQLEVSLTMTWTKSADGVIDEVILPGTQKCRVGITRAGSSEATGVLGLPSVVPVVRWDIIAGNTLFGAPALSVSRAGQWICKENFSEGEVDVIETGVERFVTKRNPDTNNKQFVVTVQPSEGLRSDLTPCGEPRF